MIPVVVEPARSDLFAEADDPSPIDPLDRPVADALHAAYAARVEVYYAELSAALGSRADDSGPRASDWPVIEVLLDGETQAVTINGDLFGVLFDLFLTDGWAPIADVERDLDRRALGEHPGTPSGGTPSRPWTAARGYFRLARSMLALLVRDALSDLERRSAELQLARLSTSSVALQGARVELGAQRFVVQSPDLEENPEAFVCANTALLESLAAQVRPVVGARADLDAALKARSDAADQAAREAVPGRSGASAADPAPADAAGAAAAAQDAETALRAYLESLTDSMTDRPWALLAVPALRPGFTTGELGTALARAVVTTSDQLEDLGRGIDPQRSRVAATLPGLDPSLLDVATPAGRQALARAVEDLDWTVAGPMDRVAGAALDAVASDVGWAPLSHGGSLEALAWSGQVNPASFEHVVLAHYLAALDERAEALAARERERREAAKTLTRVVAGVQIALLVTPLAALVPALESVTTVVGLALTAYQVGAAVSAVADLDRAGSQVLLGVDSPTGAAMARVGELIVLRRELRDALTEQMLLELVAMAAGATWGSVRAALVARGFLDDLLTVLDLDPDAQ